MLTAARAAVSVLLHTQCSSSLLLPPTQQLWRYSTKILPNEEVGPGGGGHSQEKARAQLERLEPYNPQSTAHRVSVTSKHGMDVLFDPWYNKGASVCS